LRVPAKFEHEVGATVGYLGDSDRLAVSHLHYLPTGEPEIVTEIIDPNGSETQTTVAGARNTEVSESSFDFERGLVWFLCPVYSARVDRQPRCTLTSDSLIQPGSSAPQIPPPPDDRVIGSGQPSLGFPTPDSALLLAAKRLWLFHFADRSFQELKLPETPHHIRWFEFPRAPKFSADASFAAVPVDMYHLPLFQEGQVSHGTKIIIVDLPELSILETIQPPACETLIEFALQSDQTNVTLVANWGTGWTRHTVPRVGH
jgi:hypothetical protein